tara:strand:- start:199 stop:723 length:525 start_codon:yes stop_codon:yes gene_type:complete
MKVNNKKNNSKRMLIMDSKRINDCSLRIAYQIFESNINEKEIIIIGIKQNGYTYAKKISKYLKSISRIRINLISIEFNKKKPLKGYLSSNELNQIKNKSVVLIDDVLDSGKTLIYGVKFLIEFPVKKLKTAVLVNRNHKNYPVKADFKGISLSTSVNEIISVELNSKDEGVYLS